MKSKTLALLLPAVWGLIAPALLVAQNDPYEGGETFVPPFDVDQFLEGLDQRENDAEDQEISKYSAEELTKQAEFLLTRSGNQGTILARTKLLAAVKKSPKYLPAHLWLAKYYVGWVNHFRLAFRYYKQAAKLFSSQHGSPPFLSPDTAEQHAELLATGHQIYLNLDDYEEALNILSEYHRFGYRSDWYPNSRAWILMKLGRVKEAIKILRESVETASNRGAALNMLGILLSVDGNPEQALEAFQKAVRWEQLMGPYGSPATPLNNSGEVFRERFRDGKAEMNWLKAKQMQDGCRHVLPSLNLSMLYIDQLKTSSAERSLDTFESCAAQYTENNDEEHASLVNLFRGRIALARGQLKPA